jgi:hypothetical protein
VVEVTPPKHDIFSKTKTNQKNTKKRSNFFEGYELSAVTVGVVWFSWCNDYAPLYGYMIYIYSIWESTLHYYLVGNVLAGRAIIESVAIFSNQKLHS